MTVHVFAGPSIARNKILNIIPLARLHRPIEHGAMFAINPAPGDVVAIIDGVFYLDAAVRHKEILWGAAAGAHVVGGGSMGALRAAELHGHGMTGVGRVFDLYRSGEIDGDDEVAVSHTTEEDGYRSLSIALVALREAVLEAIDADGLPEEAGRVLVAKIRAAHFPERTLCLVRETAKRLGVAEPVLGRLIRRLDGSVPDVKERDADLVLRYARALIGVPRHATSYIKTHHVTRWEEHFHQVAHGAFRVPRRLALGLLQLRLPGFPALYETVVRRRLAQLWGTSDEIDTLASEFTRRTGISEIGPELARRWLYPEATGGPEAIVRLAVVSCREAPGLMPLAAVEAELGSAGLLDTAVRICATAIDRTDHQAPSLPVIRRWIAELWGVTDDEDVLRRAALARGFLELAETERVAGRLHVLRHDDSLRELDQSSGRDGG